jgi:hypothetical protein
LRRVQRYLKYSELFIAVNLVQMIYVQREFLLNESHALHVSAARRHRLKTT